jgi:hypothetical protein
MHVTNFSAPLGHSKNRMRLGTVNFMYLLAPSVAAIASATPPPSAPSADQCITVSDDSGIPPPEDYDDEAPANGWGSVVPAVLRRLGRSISRFHHLRLISPVRENHSWWRTLRSL